MFSISSRLQAIYWAFSQIKDKDKRFEYALLATVAIMKPHQKRIFKVCQDLGPVFLTKDILGYNVATARHLHGQLEALSRDSGVVAKVDSYRYRLVGHEDLID
jgi:hypothetical protein